MISHWFCSHCGKIMNDYRQVGYEGAADENDVPDESECAEDWWFTNWVVLCKECYDKLKRNQETK